MCVLQVREGRSQRSKIVKNTANPVYNEEFFLLVDDFDHQKLSIKVSKGCACFKSSWHITKTSAL